MTELYFKDEVYRIVGAAMEVQDELGSGFLEAVYQEALNREFRDGEISFVAKPKIEIIYKGKRLEKKYEPDFLCFNEIIVEIKTLKCLAGHDEAHVLNYLKASRKKVSVFINFGNHKSAYKGQLEWKRFVS